MKTITEHANEAMNNYEIWTEGYVATGDLETASYPSFIGFYKGETFEEAVKNMVKSWPESDKYFDPVRLTWWGCRFFSNEKDARESFG